MQEIQREKKNVDAATLLLILLILPEDFQTAD